jgi:hypothetical protein
VPRGTNKLKKSYKPGALLIAFAHVWIGILLMVTGRADLSAVDIVGVDGLALLVRLEGGVLRNGFHDAWYLWLTGVLKSEGTHNGGSRGSLYVLRLACAVCVSLGNEMGLAGVEMTGLLVRPGPHGGGLDGTREWISLGLSAAAASKRGGG